MGIQQAKPCEMHNELRPNGIRLKKKTNYIHLITPFTVNETCADMDGVRTRGEPRKIYMT